MNITDELERLSALHKDGRLSDEEFAQAKSKVLNPSQQGNVAALSVILTIAAFGNIAVQLFISRFKELFAGFNMPLSLLTSLTLRFQTSLVVLSCVVAGGTIYLAWRFRRTPPRAFALAMAPVLAAVILQTALTTCALFMPVFGTVKQMAGP